MPELVHDRFTYGMVHMVYLQYTNLNHIEILFRFLWKR